MRQISEYLSGKREGGYDADRLETELEENVEETAEKHGLNNYFDDYKIDDLPEGAKAATNKKPSKIGINKIEGFEDLLIDYDQYMIDGLGNVYGKTVLDTETEFIADPVYFESSDEVQELIDVHEIMHSLQYDSEWGDELYDAGWIESENVKNYLNHVGCSGSLSLLEGHTQLVTEKRLPQGEEIGRNFYPRETYLAEAMMRRNGINPTNHIESYEEKTQGSVEMDAETSPNPELSLAKEIKSAI